MPEPSRQLAAIMFTDIVGYTALMGKDSAKALELVQLSKEIQKPPVEKHNGKWLKEMGDGALTKFNTALDAVNCALAIQNALTDDQELTLRIGIHLGDITFKDEDVFGDGVNIFILLRVSRKVTLRREQISINKIPQHPAEVFFK